MSSTRSGRSAGSGRSGGGKRSGYGQIPVIQPSRSARSARGAGRVGERHVRSAAAPRRRSSSSRGRGGDYLGSRQPRRRRSFAGVAVLLLLLVIVGGVVAWWLLTRPASALITASPQDAIITFNGSVVGTGTLELAELEPGAYPVHVERKGFQSVDTTVTLERGHRSELDYPLAPMPMPVSVITHPKGATCTITLADGSTLSGETPFAQDVPAGQVTVALAADGYNPFTRALYLDEALTLDYYMDPEGQILHGLGTITTLGAPKGVSITPDGSEAWASILDGPPSIEIFNPRTGTKVGEVDIGEYGAVEVIFNKAGTLAYTSQMETAKCFEIDVKTRKVIREFDTDSAWTKWVTLSPDEKRLYASNWSGDDVSIIDLTTGKLVDRVGVSNTPRGMYATADGKYLFVAGFDSGYLDRIDLSNNKMKSVFKDGGALRHIVGDEATGRLFVSDMLHDLIWVYDMKTGKTTKFAEVDEKPNTIDLSPDGKMLFVSCRGENASEETYYIPGPEWGTLLVFDTTNGKPLDAVIAGNQPTALDVSADGTLLISSDFLDNRLRVFEVPDYATFAAGGGGRYEEHFDEITK